MNWFAKSRNSAVWLVLVVVTLFSWESATASVNHRVASTCVLVLAFFKVRLIGLEFMELRTAPVPLRVAFEVWLVAVCALLLGLYWQIAT